MHVVLIHLSIHHHIKNWIFNLTHKVIHSKFPIEMFKNLKTGSRLSCLFICVFLFLFLYHLFNNIVSCQFKCHISSVKILYVDSDVIILKKHEKKRISMTIIKLNNVDKLTTYVFFFFWCVELTTYVLRLIRCGLWISSVIR